MFPPGWQKSVLQGIWMHAPPLLKVKNDLISCVCNLELYSLYCCNVLSIYLNGFYCPPPPPCVPGTFEHGACAVVKLIILLAQKCKQIKTIYKLGIMALLWGCSLLEIWRQRLSPVHLFRVQRNVSFRNIKGCCNVRIKGPGGRIIALLT